MAEPTLLDDLRAIADRALEWHAPNAVHQDTIVRANRIAAAIAPKPAAAPVDSPAVTAEIVNG